MDHLIRAALQLLAGARPAHPAHASHLRSQAEHARRRPTSPPHRWPCVGGTPVGHHADLAAQIAGPGKCVRQSGCLARRVRPRERRGHRAGVSHSSGNWRSSTAPRRALQCALHCNLPACGRISVAASGLRASGGREMTRSLPAHPTATATCNPLRGLPDFGITAVMYSR